MKTHEKLKTHEKQNSDFEMRNFGFEIHAHISCKSEIRNFAIRNFLELAVVIENRTNARLSSRPLLR